LFIALGVLPALVLLWDIRRFAVNVPFMDDWQFVPLLEEARNGTLTFQELWAPHDEHRLLIPRIVIIAAMFASHGDYRVQSFITFAVVAVISACLLWLSVKLNGTNARVFLTWTLANLALFSPIQFHNWLWPMQFAYFLPYTFLALCFCVLYAPLSALPKFLIAALALAGNYSFVQGNLIWLATLPVILFAPGILPDRERRKFALAWALLAMVAVALYFRGLERNSALPNYAMGHVGVPPTMSTMHQFAERPVHTLGQMGWFILAMFGNSIARGFPVADNLAFSRFCGSIVLILAGVGLVAAWHRGQFLNRSLVWACLLLFTFLTATFVCVGRVWVGEAQPLTPRYTTFGTFCVVALIQLLAAGFSGLPAEFSEAGLASTALGNGFLRTQGLVMGLYLTVQGVNWSYGRDLMEEWSITRWHSRARLHCLGKIYTQARGDLLGGQDQFIEEMAQILENLGMLKPPRAAQLKLSAFGKKAKAGGAAKGRQDQLIMRGHNGWRASGYAQLPEGRAADAVILGLEDDAGKWFAIAAATPGGPLNYLEKGTRMDLQFLANTGPQCGAWEIYLPPNIFGDRLSGVLRAWALDFRQRILYRLPGDQEFIVLDKPSAAGQPAPVGGQQ
jgi:hypothetical protein